MQDSRLQPRDAPLQLEFEEQLPKSDKRTPQGSEREALHQTGTLTQVSALFISNRHGACGLSKSGRAGEQVHPSVDQGLVARSPLYSGQWRSSSPQCGPSTHRRRNAH